MFLYIVGGLLVLILYLWRVERALTSWPDEIQKLAPHRWTDEEIRATFEQVSKKPIDFTPHLPPKLQRRYIVTGGSGLVGGHIILHLLARGQPPESIRNVDLRRPVSKDLLKGKAADIDYAPADITSLESTRAAFEKEWSGQVAAWPLTIFHCAAVIIPEERAKIFYSRVSRVNVVGTANIIAAAKGAGADILVATSSGSIAIRPLSLWPAPWHKYPKDYVQVYPDPDKDANIRPRNQYFGNYPISKAEAEDLVLKANGSSLNTGCIRPCCGVYGNELDLTIGMYLKSKVVPSWIPHIVQSFVHAENVSIAHLQYEEALLKSPETTGGRSYNITDPNQAPTFGDVYNILNKLSGFRANLVPAVPMLFLAYAIEAYCVVRATVPGLQSVLPNMPIPLRQLQPSIFLISDSHQVASNEQASRPFSEGGIGYRGVCTTIEGICGQAKKFNAATANEFEDDSKFDTAIKEVKNLTKGTAPAKV